MAKRFTDSEKFIDPWYRRLSTPNKLLWDWLTCSCDFAGLISIDLEFVEMVLGEKFEDDVIETHFSERVYKLGEFKYFIPKFIKFQYGELNPESRVHKSIIKKLDLHGIDHKRLDTLSIPYVKGVHTLKDKDKEKEKDKDSYSSFKKEEGEKNLPEKDSQEIPKIDNVIQLFNDTLAGKGKVKHCRGLSGKNIQDFLTTTSYEDFQKIETWREMFQISSESDFLTGQRSGSSFVVTLNWLVVHDNALSVLNGQYGSGSEDKAVKTNSEHRKITPLTDKQIELLKAAGQI